MTQNLLFEFGKDLFDLSKYFDKKNDYKLNLQTKALCNVYDWQIK